MSDTISSHLQDTSSNIDHARMKADSEQVKDVMGEFGKPFKASATGKVYHFRPVPLRLVPTITQLVQDINTLLVEGEKKGNDAALFADGALIQKMAQLISMGVQEKITPDQVLDEFSIGDFPKCWDLTLDANDFLSGMRNMFVKTMVKK